MSESIRFEEKEMSNTEPLNTENRISAKSSKENLSFYFAFAYASQGLSCAQFGLLAQPLQFFLMKGLGLNAADVSTNMAILMLPWIWKPVLGFFMDLFPLFGYRRKSYLILAFSIAAVTFSLLLFKAQLQSIMLCVFIAAAAMAMNTALLVGMAVEKGREDGLARHYFRIQEIFYYSAAILAASIGGSLCQHFQPLVGFQYAVGFSIVPMIGMIFLSLKQVKEEKSENKVASVGSAISSVKQALFSAPLWMACILSFLWNFLPCFGVPLYFFESKILQFPQVSIGTLSAWNSAGMLVAAFLHKRIMDKLSSAQQLFLISSTICLSTLSYFFLSTPENATFIEFFRGIANMFGILGIYCFASEHCPKRIEVTVMALLVGLRNIATNTAVYTGGQLFTFVFPNDFHSLVLISLASCALAFIAVFAWCKLCDKRVVRFGFEA